jgi:hypothetical protein
MIHLGVDLLLVRLLSYHISNEKPVESLISKVSFHRNAGSQAAVRKVTIVNLPVSIEHQRRHRRKLRMGPGKVSRHRTRVCWICLRNVNPGETLHFVLVAIYCASWRRAEPGRHFMRVS